MEEKIITGLKDLDYQGPLLQKGSLNSSIAHGSKSIEYTKLVNFLTTELRSLANLDEQVNPISSPEDSVSFLMELGSFLKELNCPYQTLTQGHVSDRLQSVEDRELLLDYLIVELMMARMNQEKEPKKKIELKLQESPEAADLKQILVTLQFPKPPADITLQMVFEKMIPKIEEVVKKTGVSLIGKAFFNSSLTDKQWKMLSELQNDLNNDYKIRREMLLTRLDVTIQSFQWSDRSKGKENFFDKIYKEERKELHADPNVDISRLLAARTDLAIIEKTSSANVRKNTKTSIHKVIIGQVPDRGGRTNEIAPPPPEMPSWQQRTPGPPGGGRGGFNQGRGGRGNFNQGGGRGSYNNQSGGGRGSYNNQSGGDQGYSGRGNNSFGNTSNRKDDTHSGFKSSLSGSSSNSRPFSNFNTSLSMYSSLSTSSFGTARYSDSKNFDSRSGSDRGTKDSSRPFDSAGSYDSPNKRPRTGYDSSNKDSNSSNYSQKRSFNIAGGNEERGNYNSRTNSGNYGGDRQSNYTAYDSAGSYDTNKRAKSYDNFRTDNASYSDQYVRDEQHNQQNHSRNGSSRGRSNYHRGQGNRYNR